MTLETPAVDSPRAQIRVGLIGCGRLGSGIYMPALAESPDFELAAIAENDMHRGVEARARAAKLGQTGVEFFPSAAALVESTKLDAVVIASPADQHLPHARIAAAAGLPALIEKPPALDRAGAVELAAFDPSPMVAFNRRFAVPPEFLAHHGCELVLELSISYLRWRWSPHSGGLDALDDVGCHLFDLALLALGTAADVRTLALTPHRVVAEIRSDRGIAHIQASNNRPWNERFILSGPDGPIASQRVGGLTSGIRNRLSGSPDPLNASIRQQLEAFSRLLRGDESGPLATATEGVAALEALAAVRASAGAQGAWVALAPPAPALRGPANPSGTPVAISS